MKHLQTFESYSINESVTDADIIIEEGRYRSAEGMVDDNNLDYDWAYNKIGAFYSNSWEDEIPMLLEGTNYESETVWNYFSENHPRQNKKGKIDIDNSYVNVTKKLNSFKESTDYASSSYEVPKWLSDEDKKKVKNIIKHLKTTVSHIQHDKYIDRIEKIIKDATPTKEDGSKYCMKDANGNTVGR
ncbi:MAG: hypothetical protein SLAVMIC_00401 [uncultured marine phage]|uniref:Uncharacterized protein n=1 Tax=uncultured marine phage TaxID=707152 RepID=A0A8D9CE43_9VIRU|nr:MAG: hypothetical protein SLAVMIC_00401 [uncultured marine phage]